MYLLLHTIYTWLSCMCPSHKINYLKIFKVFKTNHLDQCNLFIMYSCIFNIILQQVNIIAEAVDYFTTKL